MTTQTPEWNPLLLDQLDFHWQHSLRPRLQGLTDDELFWEPVRGAWNARPGAIDFEHPAPVPTPFTTIAWRLAHVLVGCLAIRSASHFGREATDYRAWPYAGSADEAIRQLDEEVATWTAGVRSLGEPGLAEPCGAAEGPFADYPMAALVLHINREVIHHGAEICLLRDLYLHTHRKDS
ncbi:MAG: hypothetical protein JWO76_42 [Nocardioides sp.]|nr:hypothetical protein [Nocardioides sp.]